MDGFDAWYADLPAEQRFSPTQLDPKQLAGYMAWANRYGYATDPGKVPEYDLAGAYLSGMTPTMVDHGNGDMRPHLGSIGQGGKLLKSPDHDTFWKAALTEIMMGRGLNPDDIPWQDLDGRDAGLRFLKTIEGTPDTRAPTESELRFFGEQPHVAGYASMSPDNRVVLNPHPNPGVNLDSVYRNESARLAMANANVRPGFSLTPEQVGFLNAISYPEGGRKETIAARLMSGDASAGEPTGDQRAFVDALGRIMRRTVNWTDR